jgi:DNA invertase Pin-like site-specific DNA recombinase
MKRLALYLRVSTLDQHPETQMYDLHQMAEQRGYRIVNEYEDRISGAKARRPGLDAMMPAAANSTSSWYGLATGSPGPLGTSSKSWTN